MGFTDLVALAQDYGRDAAGIAAATAFAGGVGGTFGTDWTLARSLVPEPTTLACLAALATIAGRRRGVRTRVRKTPIL